MKIKLTIMIMYGNSKIYGNSKDLKKSVVHQISRTPWEFLEELEFSNGMRIQRGCGISSTSLEFPE